MNRRIEVPTLVTGILLAGFGLIGVWVAQGHNLVRPIPLWFASVLLVAGIAGLITGIADRSDKRH